MQFHEKNFFLFHEFFFAWTFFNFLAHCVWYEWLFEKLFFWHELEISFKFFFMIMLKMLLPLTINLGNEGWKPLLAALTYKMVDGIHQSIRSLKLYWTNTWEISGIKVPKLYPPKKVGSGELNCVLFIV